MRRLLPVLALVLALLAAGAGLVWLKQENQRHDPRRYTGDKAIVVLVAEWCGYCKRLRSALTAANVPHTILDIEDKGEGENAYFAISRGGVPVTVIGQEVVHGYNTQRLDTLLRAQGYAVNFH
jgi:mycoredoxin